MFGRQIDFKEEDGQIVDYVSCVKESRNPRHTSYSNVDIRKRIWNEVKAWPELMHVDIDAWSSFNSVKDWWLSTIIVNGKEGRA